jgi:hypothetical protein
MDLSTQSFVSSRLFDKPSGCSLAFQTSPASADHTFLKVWFSADQTVLVENGFHLFGDGRG